MNKEKTSLLKKASSWEYVLVLLLIFEIVVFATKNPKFLMPRVLFGSLNDIISICIISLFVTFVMITGGIDIQAGALVGLTSIVLGVSWQDFGINIWLAAFLGNCRFGALRSFIGIFCSLLQCAAHGGNSGRKFPLFGACPACVQCFRYGKL